MKLICWNVNSVKQRLEHLESLIKNEDPDLILLQEIKCETDKFPYMILDNYGYNFSVIGQKTFNGVAILSKYPIEEEVKILPGYAIDDYDEQARFIEIGITINKEYWRIISVYVPNGQSLDSDKYIYKLKFYQRLEKYLADTNSTEDNLVIAGDFNVSNENIDLYDPQKFKNQILSLFRYLNTNIKLIYKYRKQICSEPPEVKARFHLQVSRTIITLKWKMTGHSIQLSSRISIHHCITTTHKWLMIK